MNKQDKVVEFQPRVKKIKFRSQEEIDVANRRKRDAFFKKSCEDRES